MDIGNMGKTKHTAGHSRPSTIEQQSEIGGGDKSGDLSPGHESRLRPVLQWFFNLAFLVRRPLTMGVRAAAFDADGRIFLVRHTYVPGWYMPGGGVEAGETVYVTLERELAEEGNLALTEPAELYGLYHNKWTNRRDHVVFFICRNVTQRDVHKPDLEIAEAGFFDIDALPDGITLATQRRLAELSGSVNKGRYW
ncbi:MAG: NUDIX domain-containing protein [Hyphomicrobiales bacterium]|nr:NUDIX domain-containing protein [Hyphomicrobiales bacterium]MCP5000392.1 NUDIX domain-containing protein [Hyphomicrobiales bacterium]